MDKTNIEYVLPEEIEMRSFEIFGMLEYSWGVSSLTITMMFLAWRKAICDGE